MTLIDSYGGPDSNAYISLTEANSLVGTMVFDPSSWTDATTLQKHAAIMQATLDIDSRQYIGFRYYHNQHLEFPRQLRSAFPWNRTAVTTTVEDTVQKRMKRNVKEACALQAFHIVKNRGRNPHLENIANGIQSVSESVGPIRESVQYGSGQRSSTAKFEPTALSLLAPWLTGRKVYRA